MCAKATSPFTGKQVLCVAAGGLFNGQSLAASLMLGASGIWVGTRFILSKEASAPKAHKEAVRTADHDDNVRTIIFTGRPLRVRTNDYVRNWEENRQSDLKELIAEGTVPVEHDLDTMADDLSDETIDHTRPFMMGKAAAVVNEEKSARDIVDEFVSQAVACFNQGNMLLVSKSKL
jgi:NAD(P)H-dependent flavin oxidoreductase YrpB (nitropropane dioxygenase family)